MKKISILGFIILGAIIIQLAQSFTYTDAFAKEPTFTTVSTDNSQYVDFTYSAEKSVEAVVHIKSKFVEDEYYRYYHPFFGRGYYNQPTEKMASGSGVIVSEDGYVVTNKHVINEAQEIEVVLNDKRSYTAKLLGTDLNTDLALLKIDDEGLRFLEFSNSDNIKVGEWVLAVGNPFNLNSTVTAGIVSAKARSINILNSGNGIESFIQTDAAINPGNSGGALVNTNGDLVGINTAIQSNTGSYTGYGFAIPSNMVQKVITDLKNYGEVRRAYIGINIADINQDIAQELNLNSVEGVLITNVLRDGAARKSGIERYDIITHINDLQVNSVSQLHEQVIQFNPGDRISCTIKRDGQIKTIEIKLES
ncbi:MAG: S1C family serine protease [Flavobacteriales bacterium]